ncbi:MAG: hypothetical protein HWE18_07940 [Gammaproteobacteria bacterium]|nr:hypothetical protein [Gammaproteobacteria bacterium]
MTDNVIHQRIEEALKAIIPFALQADEILDGLSQENKGKFKAIFPEDSPFKTSGNRFLPYMEELDADYKSLPEMQDPVFETLLTDLVKKMEAIQHVLQAFHSLRDYDDEDENPNRPLNS